ncbi:MAG: hypothetical protein R3345_10275, partial [Fulvivirga sp.]|nr:hypothetical protein [Fulvivirga sp.]
LTGLYESLKDLQEVRQQVDQMIERESDEDIQEMGEEIKDKVGEVEKELISPKQETFQDIINFRNQLDIQLFQLMQTIDNSIPPLTGGEKQLYEELNDEWQQQKNNVQQILNEDIEQFNQLLREKGIKYISPKQEEDMNEEGEKDIGL